MTGNLPVRRIVTLATAAVLGLSLLVSSTATAQEKKKTDFVAKDVKDRTVRTDKYRGKVLLVFINSHETSDKMKPITEKLILKYGHNPKVRQVTVVDLRELEFYKRPFAKEHIAGAHNRTVKRIKKLLKKEGKPPIPGLEKNLHIVMDFEGKIVEKFNHWDATKHVTVVVLNQQGDPVGSWKGSQLNKVFEAVDATLAK